MKDKQAQQQHGCVGSAVPRRYLWDQIRGVCTFNIALIKTVCYRLNEKKSHRLARLAYQVQRTTEVQTRKDL